MERCAWDSTQTPAAESLTADELVVSAAEQLQPQRAQPQGADIRTWVELLAGLARLASERAF